MNYSDLKYVAVAALMSTSVVALADAAVPNTHHFSTFGAPVQKQIADLGIAVDTEHSSCLTNELQDTHGIHLGSFKSHDGDRNWHYAGLTEMLGYIRTVPAASAPGTVIRAVTGSEHAVYLAGSHGRGNLTCSDAQTPPNTHLMVQGTQPAMLNSAS